MKNDKNLVTIYFSTEFLGDIAKIEGRLIDHGTKKYAQYNNAPFVKYVAKGKRKPRVMQKTYNPTVLVLSGVGHPDIDCGKTVIHECDTLTVSKKKYSAFDERWVQDFDQFIDQYIEKENVEVVADYRHSKGFSSYSKNH